MARDSEVSVDVLGDPDETSPLIPPTGSTDSYELRNSVRSTQSASHRLKRRIDLRKGCLRRLPKSRSTVYILLINMLQVYGYHGIITFVLDSVVNTLTHNKNEMVKSITPIIGVLGYSIPALFYPIGGIIGDSYLGRHRTSKVCLVCSWVSYVVLCISLVITALFSTDDPGSQQTIAYSVVPMLMIFLVSLSNGVFEINWLTFGADQLINSPSEEISSFIYWWYWSKNLGVVLAICTNVGVSFLPHTFTIDASCLPPFLSTLAVTVALCLDELAQRNFDIDRMNSKVISQVCGILCNAARHRPRPAFVSAFKYGEDPPSGLDYAREYHGGKYTDEQVQDIRSCSKILILVCCISGFSIAYSALGAMMSFEMQDCLKNKISVDSLHYIFSKLSQLSSDILILVFIPLWNHLLFPVLGHYLPNTRKRIGFGMVALLLAAAVAIASSLISEKHLYFVVGVIVFLALGETFVFVPILEFVYAQSPENMKGLLIGFHYFLIGLWSTITEVAFYVILSEDESLHCDSTNSLLLWYYVSCAGTITMGLLIFSIVSCCYVNRKRNDPITDLVRIAGYYR